ncbi:MAG: wax ester/triacylglycerol synthase family O-acyltransferase [Pseudomonadota bacterium]
MEQLQGMDASFVALEQRNAPMHIGSILIYDPATAPGGFVRFKDILAFFASRMQLSKTMRQRLVKVPLSIDYPYWIEDPDFDLEYHVRHVALPKPGDRRQLCIQAARIFARPLDLNRPPWEFTVVEGLDNIPDIPKGSFAMISKVHHAAIDGMSGIDLMQALHTLTPDAPPPSTPDLWKPDAIPDPFGLFFKGYVRAWTNPVRQIGVVARAAPGLFKAAKGFINKDFDIKPAVNTPRTRFNTKVSPNRVVEGRAFALDDIKALRVLSPGCKINDIFLTIIGGAMRQYLENKGELPEASLTAMAPISVRDSGEKNSMGNQVSAMLVPLGSHIADPLARLSYVHSQTINSKAMTEAMGARQMTEMSKASPALFLALGAQLYTRLGIVDVMKPMFNTVVTNVPGPPIPIYSTGAQLVSMHGLLCLTDGLALGHVVQSYCAQATITFTACRKAMPDPEFYSQCLQDSFDAMMAALAKAGADAPAVKAAPAIKPAKAKSAAAKAVKPKPLKRKPAASKHAKAA